MNGLKLTGNKLNADGYWTKSIKLATDFPRPESLALFEQNGYEMTAVEQWYAQEEGASIKKHYPYQSCLKNDWMVQDVDAYFDNGIYEGAHLNHCLLFERRGFKESALQQLEQFAKKNTLIYKLIKMKPKWGFDFSMDYADREGNVLEVLHYEYDGFDYDDIKEKQEKHERIFLSIDWNNAAKKLIHHRDEWSSLEFFEQSAWKCKYFGLDNERWKMVVWDY